MKRTWSENIGNPGLRPNPVYSGLLVLLASLVFYTPPVQARGKTEKFYAYANASIGLGASWGDSGYRDPLSGDFSGFFRSELYFSNKKRGWGLGIYAELSDPGSLIESRLLYGGGLMLVSPDFFYMSAAWSAGVYQREYRHGELSGLTTGLSIGFRPRVTAWDFLVAARVDLRTAVGVDENIVTLSMQLDLVALVALMLLPSWADAFKWFN